MKDIIASYTPEKRNDTSFWARIFSRPLSFPLTYVLINIGISANCVSVISIFIAVTACGLIMAGNQLAWVGVMLFLLWDVFDCIDGNIARVKKTASFLGEYLDAISGYTAPAFIYLSIGVAAYNEPRFLSIGIWIIVLGAVASLSDLLSRIIYQKYLVTELKIKIVRGQEKWNIESERKFGLKHLLDLVMKNMTYSSLFMPLLFIAKITSCFDILTVIYFLYSFIILIGTYVLFIRKAVREFI